MKKKCEASLSGKDEMNLAEYPITLLSHRHPTKVKTIEITDTITGEDGKLVKREWIVTGADRYGLPLAIDNDVLMAILAIGKERNYDSPKIHFSRYRLLELMGQDTKAGSNYKRVEEAMDRMKGVSIKAKNAWWDNERKCYHTVNFGIIEAYDLFDSPCKKTARQDSFHFSYVILNGVFFESIKAGYIKNFDLGTYCKLESSITKRLYRYLDKKKYDGKRQFSINLFTLAYNHIGFDKTTYKKPSLIKQKLDPAHEELINAGFLKSMEYQKTSDGDSEKVVYTFGRKAELAEPEAEGVSGESRKKAASESPGQEADPLLARLLEIGVTGTAARKILKEFSREVIQAQVDALPHRDAKDRPAALISAIREGWSLPGAFQEAEARKKRNEEEEQLRKQEKCREAELKSRVAEYLAKLSDDEMAELRKEAAEIAKSEGTAIFRDRKVSEHVLRGYVHVIVEKRLAVCV